MLSVDNFYWIIYENFLKPIHFDGLFFYPFGTTEISNVTSFMLQNRGRNRSKVLFHDQECIWPQSELVVTSSNVLRDDWIRNPRILANSEHSHAKDLLISRNRLLDWYYFYHGFAALDWYRDAEFLSEVEPVSTAFINTNHICHGDRSYRLTLMALLYQHGVLDRGQISLHSSRELCYQELQDPYTNIPKNLHGTVLDFLRCDLSFPMLLDRTNINGTASAHFGKSEYTMWQKSLIHVVNETIFYHDKLHLTEKVFKPIVAQRPFVLTAAPGNLAYLKSYGFQTFSDWIDESYDQEPDPGRRLEMIANEIARFGRLGQSDLRNIHREMQPVLDHNKKHFFDAFKTIIIDELVDNFDRCLRRWNCGRIDDRSIDVTLDFEKLKKLIAGI